MLGANLKVLRKSLRKSQEEVAGDLGLTRSSYSGYENGIAEPGLETLVALGSYYNISLNTLLTKDLNTATEAELKSAVSGMMADVGGKNLRVLTSMVDKDDNELIELIPQQVRAGYTTGYSDPDYLKVLPTFSLPFLSRDRKYRSFPIVGDSMPPVSEGSYVVAEYIQNWATLRSGTPCIVVTRDDGIVFKVANNHLSTMQSFELCSTNPLYKPYFVHVNEILEIWKFATYISPTIPDMRVDDHSLAQSIQDLQREVIELKSVMGSANNKEMKN